MEDWQFLSSLFDAIQTESPLLGQLWLKIILVFRILILATVATDLFEDEQEQFECNTAQPGCKQVCYDQAFPISQYRFWVFHIVLISTPTVLFYIYSVHQRAKAKKQQPGDGGDKATDTETSPETCSELSVKPQDDLKVKHLYMLTVGFRFLAEVAFLVGQWALYGFSVAAQYPCSRFPCPYTVDCFTSRPMEKTIFLCFYFAVGLLSAFFSMAEFVHIFKKWIHLRKNRRQGKDMETDAGEQHRLIQWTEGVEGGGGRGEGGTGRGSLLRSGSRDGSGSVSRGGRISNGGNTSNRGSWKGRDPPERSTSSRGSGKGRDPPDRSSRGSGEGRDPPERSTSSRGSGKGRDPPDRSTSNRDSKKGRDPPDRSSRGSGEGRGSLDRSTSRNFSSRRSVKSSQVSNQEREAKSQIPSLYPLNT